MTIKGQVLADLVVEFIEGMGKDGTEDGCMLDKGIMVVIMSCSLLWELYVNGATNQKDSGIRVVLISPKRLTTKKSSRLSFPAMNNEAEYEVFQAGLSVVKKLKGKAIEVFC